MGLPKTTDSGVSNGLNLVHTAVAAGDPLGTLPSGQGSLDFSIVADPTNPNIVYVGGGAQPAIGSKSSIGATTYSGRLFRGDASKPLSSQWVSLTNSNTKGTAGGGTASNSSPHADSRDMTFDALGRLIEVDAGGIYYRTSPQNNTGDWYSLVGNLAVSEVQDVVYDSISNVAIVSNQDTGVAEETAAGSTVWRKKSAKAAKATWPLTTAAWPAQRVVPIQQRSKLGQLGVRRQVDADNNVVATATPALTVVGTDGQTFYTVDGGQLDTPIAVNVVDPSRLVIGGTRSV